MRSPGTTRAWSQHPIVRLFADRRLWVRQVFVTAVAGAAAWQVGDALITQGGVTAAIAAAITVQMSLHKSMREGFGQILGTAIGAGVALGSEHFFGLGAITVAITIGLGAVASRALRLGGAATVNVSVTALIVIGPGPSENTAWHRLAAIVIGALIAIGLSYFSHPKNPEGRTIDEIARLATATAELLSVMSVGTEHGFDRSESGRWLARARVLTSRVPRVRAQALEARDYARWFPLADKAIADDLFKRALALDHAVDEVANIARALFDASVSGGMPTGLNRNLSEALALASFAMSATAVELRDEDELALSAAVTEDVRQASADLAEQLLEDSADVDQEQIVRGMSIASGIDRIADSLDQSAPAIHEVPEPGPPTAELVLKLPKRKGGKRRK
jgi:hypothetical protein